MALAFNQKIHTCNVAYYSLYIHDRKWHLSSGKSTSLIALVTNRSERTTAHANAWRKGVMGDRRISRKLKGKMLSSCVTQAYMNALETMALTEKQQENVQFCENNMARIIVGVKRADNKN